MHIHPNEVGQFSLVHLLEDLKHYLPSQTPIKDFIHHNSLHAFQHDSFYDGIFKARNIFGYNVTLSMHEFRNLYYLGRINKEILEKIILYKKGKQALSAWMYKLFNESAESPIVPTIGQLRKHWKAKYRFNLDNHVQPVLFRMVCAYLDQGIAITQFPNNELGFLATLQQMDTLSVTSIFTSPRVKKLFNNPHTTIHDLLKIIVGNESFYFQYIFDQQFSHRGWSGMVATIEAHPHTLLIPKKISLEEFIYFELLLEIDALDQKFKMNWSPLCADDSITITDIFSSTPLTETDEMLIIFQDAFEWSYYDKVLAAVQKNYQPNNEIISSKEFQAVFCIDERECSFRRYIEKLAITAETFGAPGFFGVEFYFKADGSKFIEKLCPAPVTPKYLIKESNSSIIQHHSLLYNKIAHTIVGGALFNITAGFISLIELFKNLLKPAMTPAISNAFSHVGHDSDLTIENVDINNRENDLQIGFTVEEMAVRVEAQLLNIGLIKHFAPIIYMVAHGSSSANNPHHGAHDCGACSGRPGSVNARVFSFMANHPGVRRILYTKGITIPPTTQFIGALHDTAADQIVFFDLGILNEKNKELHHHYAEIFEEALNYNAKERSRRFASINTKSNKNEIRKAIQKRSVSLFEPRPELGHGSNALCIIGRRAVSKNIFLDRRAFLNSYDYTLDPTGELLRNIIRPIGPVCGGINLEYYFSRIDNHKLGAGTKLPHNVMGLIGVANSSDGDLRPGLPLQMIEIHDPVRLLVIVEQNPAIVLQVIQSDNAIYEWYAKGWIHLVVINPFDQLLYVFKNNQFELYHPIERNIDSLKNLDTFLENTREMSSFTIEDATQENLPVHHLN